MGDDFEEGLRTRAAVVQVQGLGQLGDVEADHVPAEWERRGVAFVGTGPSGDGAKGGGAKVARHFPDSQ